jgi:hypothetical protein
MQEILKQKEPFFQGLWQQTHNIVKGEEDDDLSLPSQDTEPEGETHCSSGSVMHVTGREERTFDNWDITGTNVKAQFTYLLGQ